MANILSPTPTPSKDRMNLEAGDIGLMLHDPSYLIRDLGRSDADTYVKFQDTTTIMATILQNSPLCKTFQIALPPTESECYASI